MPHLFFNGSTDEPPLSTHTPPPDDRSQDKENMWGRTWSKVGHWIKQDDENGSSAVTEEPGQLDQKPACQETGLIRPSRSVLPGIPRPLTFARQDSERREKLYPHEPCPEERRATSVDRRVPTSNLRELIQPAQSELGSDVLTVQAPRGASSANIIPNDHQDIRSIQNTVSEQHGQDAESLEEDLEVQSQYDYPITNALSHHEQLSNALDGMNVQNELEAQWILNLSMHFRDNSDREKFFITYAEEPTKWRRVTVSCDYRNAPSDSLEADLKSLHYQRDKSAQIYKHIRESLPQIQFYETVTNLKLETSDGRLHVHVTEDVNEVVQFPAVSTIEYLELPRISEQSVEFDCHMSGYVYKVRINGNMYIKKEIPGPEAIEEFLYEVNALSNLRGSSNVVYLEGVVVDDKDQHVKGLLLSYCEQGALVDLIYDFRGSTWLSWARRERWAKQIINGLAEIHEAGFVQGDFTLSNIVIDQDDNARIIDINRRGCPIGWEPPELIKLIQAGQRISMYIGSKSDIFQLGMVLWALAEQQDEPERQERPLRFGKPDEIPAYYRNIVETCIAVKPKERLPATELLKHLPMEQPLSWKNARPSQVLEEPIQPDRQHYAPTPTDIADEHQGPTVYGLEEILPADGPSRDSRTLFPASESTFAEVDSTPEYLVVESEDSVAQPMSGSLNSGNEVVSTLRNEHTVAITKDPVLPQAGKPWILRSNIPTSPDPDAPEGSQSKNHNFEEPEAESCNMWPPEDTHDLTREHLKADYASQTACLVPAPNSKGPESVGLGVLYELMIPLPPSRQGSQDTVTLAGKKMAVRSEELPGCTSSLDDTNQSTVSQTRQTSSILSALEHKDAVPGTQTIVSSTEGFTPIDKLSSSDEAPSSNSVSTTSAPIERALGDSPPLESTVASQPNISSVQQVAIPARSNTLLLKLPIHQDSGFDGTISACPSGSQFILSPGTMSEVSTQMTPANSEVF